MTSNSHSVDVHVVIKIRGVNPYVLISKQHAKLIKNNWKKPMPVLVQVNGQPDPPWQINMMPVGDGSFYLYLHGDVRKVWNTKVGDKITVSIAFNNLYHNGPQHIMPESFSNALKENSEANKNWQALAPSRQKEILRYFSWLKSEKAIHRNLERAIQVLSGMPGRFMARSWNNGK